MGAKYLKIAVFIAAFSTSVFSSEIKSEIDLAGLNEMQRFYYDKGAEDTKEKAYLAGYKQAMDDFTKKILPAYAKNIKAYEAGKYLIKEGKITYPRVFRYKDGDSYKIQIEPPAVEKQFTEKDLYALPEFNYNFCTAKQRATTDKEETAGLYAENSFALPARDDVAMSRDSAPEVRKSKVVVHLPYKNEGIEQAVGMYNIDYSITKDGYDLFFSNDAEKTDFCMKVTGNGKCQL